MEYSITITENDYQKLLSHLFVDRIKERAAYLLCRFAVSESEIRLLVREVIPVINEDIIESSFTHMSIKSASYVKTIKRARDSKHSFIFVHSHPSGSINHSTQDDMEERNFFHTVYKRVEGVPVHASLVISDSDKPIARVWLNNGTNSPVSVIRVIGDRFHFFSNNNEANPYPHFFDRQIRIFGEEMQKTLKKLKIGIVGLGGTGSAVAEQLIRLGVGTLYIFDPEIFDTTNVNRVYGSSVSDGGKNKTEIIERLANQIGLGTIIKTFNKSISHSSTINELKKCDIVFGCTDDHWGRSILCRLAIYYYIPIFDMGVKINSKDSLITSIQGRTTVLLPNHACLLCRDQINPKMISSESLEATNPIEAKKKRKEGYLPELPDTAPSVIPFTTMVASTSVIEFLHRMTGLLGDTRKTNEVIHLFDQARIGKNSRESKEECFCGNSKLFGLGDVNPFLDITWRNEN